MTVVSQSLPGARNWCPQELSVRQLFSHVLDIFGKPNRKFFETLSFFAKAQAIFSFELPFSLREIQLWAG